MRKLTILMIFAYALMVVAWPATATLYLLEDLNSSSLVDDGSDEGMSTWLVEGTDNLFQQWFWIRFGDGPEQSIDTIDADGPLSIHADNDFDPGLESLQLRYEGSDLQIDVSLELVGGLPGSDVSDLLEAIAINNIGQTVLDLHFFQYVDFDLAGTAGDDTVQVFPPYGVTQSEGAGWVSETADTPAPDRYEAALVPTIINKLRDANADDLSNATGPITGDVAWSFQWDFVLGPNDSFIISKNKHLVVPEPATLGLLLIGGAALLKRRS